MQHMYQVGFYGTGEQIKGSFLMPSLPYPGLIFHHDSGFWEVVAVCATLPDNTRTSYLVQHVTVRVKPGRPL
jgi:hypothetical protein